MNSYISTILSFLFLTALIVAGCTDQPLAPQPEEGLTMEDPDMTSYFVGRDSLGPIMLFGVAFQARVSGEWTGNGDCKTLAGTGSATHLGRIEIEHQRICFNGEEITEGEFKIVGRRGHLAGEYPHEVQDLEQGSQRNIGGRSGISAGVKVTDADVQPTRLKDVDAADKDGWGWISIELNEEDRTFTYQIVAWLHHNQVEAPGLGGS